MSEKDLTARIKSDIEDLRNDLKNFSKEDVCSLLECYVATVRKEDLGIGLREFSTYVQMLTDEINDLKA